MSGSVSLPGEQVSLVPGPGGSTYTPSNVAITGGTIDGTVIGGTTPANGTFVRLTTTGFSNLKSIGVGMRVVTASGNVTATGSDCVIVINKTVPAATTVTLMSSPALGQIVVIKDGGGNASTNAITITPASGTIDGAASQTITTNYGVMRLVYNGTQWNVW